MKGKFFRYCDIVNPVHFQVTSMARSAISAMRLRDLLLKVRNKTVTDVERRELSQLAQKILDTDTAAHDHIGIKDYFLMGIVGFR